MVVANNNRKTKHRRPNGKVVTVRHRQYPSNPNTMTRKISFKGKIQEHKGLRKSCIRHGLPESLLTSLSGISQDFIHRENRPNKNGRIHY